MSTRVETRRSSRKSEPGIVLNGNTYGTRSLAKTNLLPEVQDATSFTTRKRVREDSARQSTIASRRRSFSSHSATHEHKKARPDTDATPKKSATIPGEVMADDQTASGAIGGSPAVTTQRKQTPAMARMRVLEERFARIVAALLRSEAKHTERKISEIKKGCCRELNEAFKPLQDTYQKRLAVADRKLALQKAEADQTWHATRTSAQYAFVSNRAELRTKLQATLSQRVFDISREYREMSLQSIGLENEQMAAYPPQRPPQLKIAPSAATLTEKDEDFLLMNIPARRQTDLDDHARRIAPILNALARPVTSKSTAQSQKPQSVAKRAHGSSQKNRRLESTVPHMVAAPSADSVASGHASHLPSVSSLLGQEKNPQRENNQQMYRDIHHYPNHAAASAETRDLSYNMNYGEPREMHRDVARAGPPYAYQSHSTHARQGQTNGQDRDYSPWPPRHFQTSGVDPPHRRESSFLQTPDLRNNWSSQHQYSQPPSYYPPIPISAHPSSMPKNYIDPGYQAILNDVEARQAHMFAAKQQEYQVSQLPPPISRPSGPPSGLLHPFKRTENYTEALPLQIAQTRDTGPRKSLLHQPMPPRYDQPASYAHRHEWTTR